MSRDPVTTPELVYAGLEYLNVLLLMDANALYFAGRELQSRAPHLLRIIETVGESTLRLPSRRFEPALNTGHSSYVVCHLGDAA